MPPSELLAQRLDASASLSTECTDFYTMNRTALPQAITSSWQEARRIAGLPPLQPAQLSARRFLHLTHVFYNTWFESDCFDAGVCTSTSPPSPAFAYVRVWKSANNFLKQNIQRICTSSGECPTRVGKRDENAHRPGADQRLQFAFVREPLEHFLSGYTETTWRTYLQCCAKSTRANAGPLKCASGAASFGCASDQGAVELAQEFVLALLDADASRVWSGRHALIQPQHMYVQSGILRRFRPNFIGRLESIEEDWNRLAAKLRLPLKAQRMELSLGRHPNTSSDELGRRGAMLKLFMQQPRLKQAVQRLLLIDYECFRYGRPS